MPGKRPCHLYRRPNACHPGRWFAARAQRVVVEQGSSGVIVPFISPPESLFENLVLRFRHG